MAGLIVRQSLALTGIEIRYLDGMKVTVEKVYDNVHDVGSSVHDLKIGQAEVQDRLNAMYIMLCGGKESFSSTNGLKFCLIAPSLSRFSWEDYE